MFSEYGVDFEKQYRCEETVEGIHPNEWDFASVAEVAFAGVFGLMCMAGCFKG